MPEYSEWTDEELADEEARLSEAINALSGQIATLRSEMRDLDQQVNPIRNEIEDRKYRRARRDPRTQGVKG